MVNQYAQMRKFSKRVDSIIDAERSKKSAKRDTRGLLARKNPAQEMPGTGQEDFTKRIANYVNTVRAKRLEMATNPRGVIEAEKVEKLKAKNTQGIVE
jgi:hypothetical protein